MIETPVFIKVPSVYSVKIPGGEWLNLALIRRLQFESSPATVHITWENGDTGVYYGDKAIAIIEAWGETHVIDKSQIGEPDIPY